MGDRRHDVLGGSTASKLRQSLALVTAVALSNLSIPGVKGGRGTRDQHRKLFIHTEWTGKVFAAGAGNEINSLDIGEPAPSSIESLAAPSQAPSVGPKRSSPSSATLPPFSSLVDFPSLVPVASTENEPTTGQSPAFPTPVPPFTVPFSAPLPHIPSEVERSASPSEHIDYGYEYPPTISPTSSSEPRPVVTPVSTPSVGIKERVSPTEEPASTSSMDSPSILEPSDHPSDVPSEAPSDAPSFVPTITTGKRDPINNAAKFRDANKLPESPKASNIIQRGKAGGKAGIPKLSKKSKKGKSKSKRCTGSAKETKSPSKKSKAPKKRKKSHSSESKSKVPHYCTPTASPYPSFTPGPSVTPESTSEQDVVLRANCDAMKRGEGNVTGPAQSYTVNFILIISDSVNQTIGRLENILQEVVAANLAGCIAEESTNITNVVFAVYEDDDMPACATDVANTSCHHLDADARVYYKDENVTRYSASDFYNYLTRFCDDFKNLPGVEKTFDPCSAMDVTDNGPAPSAATASQQRSIQGISIGGLVAVVLAALCFIVVVIFAARRNQKKHYPLKHHPLEEYDDATYLKDDFDTTSHASRRALVFNEDDSIFSGLTSHGARGLDPPSSLANRPHQQDVHVCTSATCEVCEKRRQSSLQFIPAVMPSQSSGSLSRPRSFVATDTIQL